MPSDRPTAAALPLALFVCVLVAAGVVATPGVAVGEPLTTIPPQDPADGEAVLDLDRSTRRLIQQELRNQGFDPGTPDGLFGPRTRAAIREWQRSRGASPTGYLNGAEAQLLRTAATPAPEAPPPLQVVPAVASTASSTAAAPASTPTETEPSPPSPATAAAEEVDPQNTAETNTPPGIPASGRDGTVQLAPEIIVDRHLLRAERLLADGEPDDALEAMNEILALQQEHALVLHEEFDFEYAQVAYAAGRTETAIASANQYLASAGREGEFYREALELLDSAEVRLEREAAERRRAELERRRAEAERQRAARWPPGHVFRDCETCPEMVVLPGSAVALGRYEVTLGDYRAFTSATAAAAGSGCSNLFSNGDDNDRSWRNPGFPQTDRHPVTCLSWDDAQTYISWLRERTGAAYRLPTREELRGATVPPPGCDMDTPVHLSMGTCGCHSRNPYGELGTCPVDTYGGNRMGLSDMLGNVDEWTSSCWGGRCDYHVPHGGSWRTSRGLHFGGAERGYTATTRTTYVGLRVARALEYPAAEVNR